MEKFLKIFVTAADYTAGNRYVTLSNILQVLQVDATTVTVTYNNAEGTLDVLTITHGAIATNATTMRDWFTDNMVVAFAQSWQKSAVAATTPLPDNAAGTAPVTITEITLA